MAEFSIENQLKTLSIASPQLVQNENITQEEILRQSHRKRLVEAVKQQELERDDTSFSRDCILCRKHFVGNRSLLFQHLLDSHHLFIGQPDNIVYVNEFLDVLNEKLKKFECFYCEKTFKDWMVLKEHMRKKQHKQLNPRNPVYDKYYMINYLEPGRNWQDLDKIRDFDDDDDNFEEELMECEQENNVYCLFCNKTTQEIENTLQHMKDMHHFDLRQIITENRLNFYAQVSLINYIRDQVSRNICPTCEEQFEERHKFYEHLYLTNHPSLLPMAEKWNGPIFFYFPVIENDKLITGLENEDPIQESSHVVIPEEIHLPQDSVLYNEITRKELF